MNLNGVTSGSKPHVSGCKSCPHCGRTISANKEMCFAGVVAFGTLKAFESAQKAGEESSAAAAESNPPDGGSQPKEEERH